MLSSTRLFIGVNRGKISNSARLLSTRTASYYSITSHPTACNCALCSTRLTLLNLNSSSSSSRFFSSQNSGRNSQEKSGDQEVAKREKSASVESQSQNHYEDMEPIHLSEPEQGNQSDDPNIVMDHVQMARRIQKQPREQNLHANQSGGDTEGNSVVDKPESGSTAPSGVSYS